jgi:GT2 family glycosyltransferase
VDNGSRDNTAEVCDLMRRCLPNLKYVSTGINTGLAHARNEGVKAALGNYILFTDDDCVVDHNWVERMSAALDQEPIIAGAVASPTESYLKLCHNISQFHYFMPGQGKGPKDFIAGANMGLRR